VTFGKGASDAGRESYRTSVARRLRHLSRRNRGACPIRKARNRRTLTVKVFEEPLGEFPLFVAITLAAQNAAIWMRVKQSGGTEPLDLNDQGRTTAA